MRKRTTAEERRDLRAKEQEDHKRKEGTMKEITMETKCAWCEGELANNFSDYEVPQEFLDRHNCMEGKDKTIICENCYHQLAECDKCRKMMYREDMDMDDNGIWACSKDFKSDCKNKKETQ